jgi:hypothetical protein
MHNDSNEVADTAAFNEAHAERADNGAHVKNRYDDSFNLGLHKAKLAIFKVTQLDNSAGILSFGFISTKASRIFGKFESSDSFAPQNTFFVFPFGGI